MAVDADVDEDAELSPSVGVVESMVSRDDEGLGSCSSVVEAEAESEAGEETERVASCLLSPCCTCETKSPKSLRAACMAL